MILDACRNNPFARKFRSSSQGLAQMDAPSGTLVAFATAPGSVASDGTGKNGIYTQHLLASLGQPGVPVEQLFKRVRVGVMKDTRNAQVPWESSSLVGDFYFKPGAASATADPAAIELVYWDSIKDSQSADDYKGYLKKYPNGLFADIAKRRALNPPKPATTAVASIAPLPATKPEPSPGAVAGKVWNEPVTGMEFVWIPKGCFQMGSPISESGKKRQRAPTPGLRRGLLARQVRSHEQPVPAVQAFPRQRPVRRQQPERRHPAGGRMSPGTTPSPTPNGSRPKPARPSNSPPRPNGNTPPAPAPRPPATGAMTMLRSAATPTSPTARARWRSATSPGPTTVATTATRSVPPSAVSPRMLMACTTCSAMSGSGRPRPTIKPTPAARSAPPPKTGWPPRGPRRLVVQRPVARALGGPQQRDAGRPLRLLRLPPRQESLTLFSLPWGPGGGRKARKKIVGGAGLRKKLVHHEKKNEKIILFSFLSNKIMINS